MWYILRLDPKIVLQMLQQDFTIVALPGRGWEVAKKPRLFVLRQDQCSKCLPITLPISFGSMILILKDSTGLWKIATVPILMIISVR